MTPEKIWKSHVTHNRTGLFCLYYLQAILPSELVMIPVVHQACRTGDADQFESQKTIVSIGSR